MLWYKFIHVSQRGPTGLFQYKDAILPLTTTWGMVWV